MLENRRILFMLVTILLATLLLSSCSHFENNESSTSETIMTSSDTTTDNDQISSDTTIDDDQTSSETDGDGTTGELRLPPVEDLITPDPNRSPLASSDVLATIARGTSLDDLITTAGLPQRIEKMIVFVSSSETTSVAIPMELPCLSYDTSEGTTYVYSIYTHKLVDEQDWTREVYSVRVTDFASTNDE